MAEAPAGSSRTRERTFMPPSTHRVETLSWRVVKPNAPVPGRNPAPVPVSLRFLSAPSRPNSPDACTDDTPLGTVFQASGSLLIEVPLAGEVSGMPPVFGFVSRHQA